MNPEGDLPKQPQPFNPLKVVNIVATVFLIAIIVGIGGYLLGSATRQKVPSAQPTLSPQAPTIGQLSPTLIMRNTDDSLLDEFPRWNPRIQWNTPQPDTHDYYLTDDEQNFLGYKTVPGFSLTSTVGEVGLPEYLDDIDRKLKSMDWYENQYISSSGPSGDAWGYEKKISGKRRILVLWSTLQSCIRTDEGPCYKETVFYSDKF